MIPAIETTNVTKVLQNVTAVDDVSISIPQGTIYGIVGANGAGKTTLLRLLNGLMWPTSGSIRVFGQLMERESAELRQRIGCVSHEGTIYPSFRVRDLIQFSSSLYTNWDNDRCERLVSALELPKQKLIRHLSLGMRMQLRLVINLSARLDVLLLDEPMNGLDVVVKRQFLQLILEEAANDGTTVLIATHQLVDLERVADGLIVMYRGKVISDARIDDIKAQIRTYQVLLPNGMPTHVKESNQVIQIEQRGSIWTVVADDANGQIEQALRRESSHFEVITQDLEDILTHLLRKEGYSREAILLA